MFESKTQARTDTVSLILGVGARGFLTGGGLTVISNSCIRFRDSIPGSKPHGGQSYAVVAGRRQTVDLRGGEQVIFPSA